MRRTLAVFIAAVLLVGVLTCVFVFSFAPRDPDGRITEHWFEIAKLVVQAAVLGFITSVALEVVRQTAQRANNRSELLRGFLKELIATYNGVKNQRRLLRANNTGQARDHLNSL